MQRIVSFVFVVVSLGVVVGDLVTTTIAANARSKELKKELARVLPPPGATLKRAEAHAATRRATATSTFEGRLATVDLLAHYRRALEADGWSACGMRRSGYVYTGEVIDHYVFCRGSTDSATVSIEKANAGETTRYTLTLEWNTRWWWISVVGLALILTAVIGLQAGLRRQAVRTRPSVILRTELRLDECRRRLELLARRDVDGLVLRRREAADSIVHFELERRRSRWDLNALAVYFHGTLRPDGDGTRVEGRFGLSPAAKSVTTVIGVLFLIGVAFQARDAPATAILTAGIIMAVAVVAIRVAPRLQRADRSLVEQVLERELGVRRVA